MRIRHFIAALMVLLSLTAQARTAFACAMMPGAAQAACCCDDGARDHCPPSGSAACCDQVAPADAPLAMAAASACHGGHADSFHPPAGPAPYLLPAAFDTGDHRSRLRPVSAPLHRPLPAYLLTARLRL